MEKLKINEYVPGFAIGAGCTACVLCKRDEGVIEEVFGKLCCTGQHGLARARR